DNRGTISGSDFAGIYVQNHSNISGGITNESGGTISGGFDGIVVQSSVTTGGITSTGTIQGTGGAAISFFGLTGTTPIHINGGHIIGNVTDNLPDAGNSPVTVGGAFATGGNFTVSDLILPTGGNLTISPGNTFTVSQMTGGTGLGGAGTLT